MRALTPNPLAGKGRLPGFGYRPKKYDPTVLAINETARVPLEDRVAIRNSVNNLRYKPETEHFLFLTETVGEMVQVTRLLDIPPENKFPLDVRNRYVRQTVEKFLMDRHKKSFDPSEETASRQ